MGCYLPASVQGGMKTAGGSAIELGASIVQMFGSGKLRKNKTTDGEIHDGEKRAVRPGEARRLGKRCGGYGSGSARSWGPGASPRGREDT